MDGCKQDSSSPFFILIGVLGCLKNAIQGAASHYGKGDKTYNSTNYYSYSHISFKEPNYYSEVGGEPPEFELVDLEGNVHEPADYKGKPYIINFWGTFCPPCVKEMPEFQRQYEKWSDQGLAVLAIYLSIFILGRKHMSTSIVKAISSARWRGCSYIRFLTGYRSRQVLQ